MPPRKRTALLVDDNAMVRLLLCGIFESAGFRICAEAANGAEAIEQAARYEPDLIVLDLCMPVMNGLEAAKVLRKTLPTTPIILFTMVCRQYSDKGSAGSRNQLGRFKIRCEHAD